MCICLNGSQESLDDEVLGMPTEEIVGRARLLENDIKVQIF